MESTSDRRSPSPRPQLATIINNEPKTPPGSPVRRTNTPNTQNCPVCLGPINNVSFTDTCAHEFCFNCLVQWSRVKSECPLCKRRFQEITYNVKSAIDFSKLSVADLKPEIPAVELDLAELRLFRYPSTMATTSDFTRRNQNREVAAIRRRLQQMVDDMRQRALDHMRLRLYRNRLKTVIASDGRIREATPAFFKRYPASVHRLLPFLNRELRVLLEDDRVEVRRLLNIINKLLPRYSIVSSEFIDGVRPLLGSRARRFCQELMTFAQCPYDLAGFDRNAVYEVDAPPIDVDAEPEPVIPFGSPEFNPNQGVCSRLTFGTRTNEEVSSTATSSSQVPLQPLDSATSYAIEISSASESEESTDSDNAWIDVGTVPSADEVLEILSEDEHPPSSPGSDCLIVGFDKPWEQRSPVLLNSDSEDGNRLIKNDNSLPASRNVMDEVSPKRLRLSSDPLDSSSNNGRSPSPSMLAARGKRWSPRLLAAAAGSCHSSFLPLLPTDTILTRSINHHGVSTSSSDEAINGETIVSRKNKPHSCPEQDCLQ